MCYEKMEHIRSTLPAAGECAPGSHGAHVVLHQQPSKDPALSPAVPAASAANSASEQKRGDPSTLE